ncbi:hypothetical protein NPIL_85381 [Nephila pilipes]|uniref:Uncharacterized protein n=1 Tax=Nephila pilipes TaxID=299642 RepID=A0A8X6UHQ8_NEPPI|nr:hypothetical protein NPIL_85381 [Nephila pilipes]
MAFRFECPADGLPHCAIYRPQGKASSPQEFLNGYNGARDIFEDHLRNVEQCYADSTFHLYVELKDIEMECDGNIYIANAEINSDLVSVESN